MKSHTFPKRIWFLWFQGFSNAPEIVVFCYNSWIKYNPDYEVVLLHYDNLHQYLDPESDSLCWNEFISPQARSDIIRINLLSKYGGVWVDSTCFCTMPLNQWLPEYMEKGFFAFTSPPRKSTMISSWFLASEKHNYITSTYCNAVNSYWNDHPHLKPWNRNVLTRMIFKWTGLAQKLDNDPQRWFSDFYLNTLKIHPYFWFHYLFENVYNSDLKFKSIWNKIKPYSSDIPHKLQLVILHNEITPEIKNEITRYKDPFYKLYWRVNLSELSDTSVLITLLKHHKML